MAPTTFSALKDKRDPLVFSALDWLVLLHPWSEGCPYMPTDLTDASGVLQTLPAGWVTAGEIQKKAGIDLTPDTKSEDVEGYGSSAPRRTIVTGEGFQIDYTGQEWRKINLEMYHNTDLSTVSAVPGKGFKARKTTQLTARYYSAILLAYDGMPTEEIMPFFEYGKVSVTKRNKMSGQQGAELGLPMTLTAYEDSAWGSLYDFGVCGAGFDAVAADAGFVGAATAIEVTPATATLPVGGQVQLLVIDDNGFDRTAECTWASSNTARATVDATGRVTAVATGTAATITATLGALNDTAAVTVS
ncbi:Ig-like domain-containing protein [Nocardia wallacei]|uniref:Ig-like domain-containing protein n=1 Tax=Nocardia wallacei TaxID=480035 RepID=UPI0024541822|nr:Ig-like domain-containing protein [Nocardia wallacei]